MENKESKETNKVSKETKAVLRYVRISPYKTRLVADLIRGKNAEEALNILKFTPKKAARIIYKLLNSAINNAKVNKLDIDNLFLKTIFVDQGPMLKRYRPRAMRRATPIRKRTSHITMILGLRK